MPPKFFGRKAKFQLNLTFDKKAIGISLYIENLIERGRTS
jgi:hypothetical protein